MINTPYMFLPDLMSMNALPFLLLLYSHILNAYSKG